MKITTAKKLDKLLKEFITKPYDLDLINKIAIGYFENPSECQNNEDYEYFKKAYELQKTIKSMHNYAWFLYFDWSELEYKFNSSEAIEKALNIQEECIKLKPKSYLPYYLYGYMLLEKEQNKLAIKYLERADKIIENDGIKHNLGIAYFKTGNFEQAKEYFQQAIYIKDLEKHSLYNLALVEYQKSDFEAMKIIIKELYNKTSEINAYEIGILYFLLEDYSKVTECVIKEGIEKFSFLEWQELAYSIYKTDKKLFFNKIENEIAQKKTVVAELKNNNDDWADYSEEEKKFTISTFEREIEALKKLETTIINKPSLDLNKYLAKVACVCLLFDCERHGNPKND